jgi:hypothetical protein
MSKRVGALMLLSLALAGACSGRSGGSSSPTTLRTLPPTTTTTTPYAVPTVIDEAYVERVLNALNKIEGDAMREIVNAEDLVPPAAEKLRTIYLRAELNEQLRVWNQAVVDGFTGYRHPPRDIKTRVESLPVKSPTCIEATTIDDLSSVGAASAPERRHQVVLRPRDEAQDPQKLNPTPWMVALKLLASSATRKNPCAGS